MSKLAFPKEPGASRMCPSLCQPQDYFLCYLPAFYTPHPRCEHSSHFLTPSHLQTGPGNLQAVDECPLLDPVALVEEVAVPSPTKVPEQTALPADQQHRAVLTSHCPWYPLFRGPLIALLPLCLEEQHLHCISLYCG